MTEYKIVLYYEKPMPEFFQNSMEAMLKRGVEQGFISGYEFQKKELDSGKVIKQTTLKDSAQIKKEYEESLETPPEPMPLDEISLTKLIKETAKDERKPVKDDTPGLDTRAEKGTKELRGARGADRVVQLHKTLRSDKPDNSKKGGRKV